MSPNDEFPTGSPGGKYIRGALNAAGGAIPFAGGVLSAISGAWSESEQERVNSFFHHWLEMMKAELTEKQQTVIEIMQRLDMHAQEIADRVSSKEYQSLLRKGFRDWAGAESNEKRVLIRNLLSNAAAATIASDDIVRLFLEWVKKYSELHFAVISKIFNHAGITREQVWAALGKAAVREDSADADLFKLLFRDLSTGGIIRQHKEVDYQGNFLKKQPARKSTAFPGQQPTKSAFDDQDSYELTQLGSQFVHYAMTDLPIKISYTPKPEHNGTAEQNDETQASRSQNS